VCDYCAYLDYGIFYIVDFNYGTVGINVLLSPVAKRRLENCYFNAACFCVFTLGMSLVDNQLGDRYSGQ